MGAREARHTRAVAGCALDTESALGRVGDMAIGRSCCLEWAHGEHLLWMRAIVGQCVGARHVHI